jgi:hypothetical protein
VCPSIKRREADVKGIYSEALRNASRQSTDIPEDLFYLRVCPYSALLPLNRGLQSKHSNEAYKSTVFYTYFIALIVKKSCGAI